MVAFLQLNGWRLDAGIDDAESIILRTASGAVDKSVLIDWVRINAHEKPRLELREFFALVSTDRLIEQLRAFQLSGKSAQIQVSVDEAKHAIPILQWIDSHTNPVVVSDRLSPADVERIRSEAMFQGMSVLLGSLYRIAEDMGYEW